MLKKRFLICLVLLVALLVANLAMIQAASSSDLTFTLNSSGDGYVVTSCKSTASGSLSIPSSYNSKPVVEIGRDAFLNCTGLTSVTIPTSVKTIGWYAFSGCTGLTSITIPDSVTTLDWFTFADCTALTNVTVGNGVTCIDASAFAGCTKLSSVTLGNGVTSIGWSAFKDCAQLNSINIPHGVTSIERYAFYNCSSLSSVTFCGTSQEWSAITKGEGNDILSSVTVTYHKYSNCVCSLCQDSQHSPAAAVKENEKAATCAAAGSYESVVYCSSCKVEISRKTVSVPATSHTEVIDEAVAATCTESGLTEGKHCSVCNEVLVARTVVDALGHTEQTVPGYAATCTRTGLTDGVICSVCDAVITEQTEIPVTDHNYVDGTCTICGDAKESLPYPFQSNTVELSSQLNININTQYDVLGFASAAEAQASGYYALVTRIDENGNSVESTIPASDWIGHTKSRVRIPYNSWNPTQMVDTFKVVICNNNGEVVTEEMVTSVVDIVMSQIQTYSAYNGTYDDLITVFVDLLNYGAASQVQFQYNVNNLANANLGDWQSYATTEIVYPEAKDNSSVACYQTTSLELKSRVDLQLQLWTDSFGVDVSEVVAEISYTNFNGQLVEKTVYGTDFQPHTNKNGRGRCKVIVSWIDIPDCMQDVTIVLKDSDGNEIATITESIISKLGYYYEQYPTNEIYSEMIKFISSAYAYFAG